MSETAKCQRCKATVQRNQVGGWFVRGIGADGVLCGWTNQSHLVPDAENS